jgi:cell division protein FtsB
MPSTPRSRRSKEDPEIRIKLPRIDLDRWHLPKIKLPSIDPEKLPKLPVKQVLIVLGLGVAAVIMLNLNSRLNEYNRLTLQREQIAAQVTDLAATHTALETQVAFARSDEAAEIFAREAHLVMPGEVLVVPLPKPGEATPMPDHPVEIARPVQNWEVWWALFFEQ